MILSHLAGDLRINSMLEPTDKAAVIEIASEQAFNAILITDASFAA